MKKLLFHRALAACAAATLLAGCENEEQTRRIRDLEQESSDRSGDIEDLRLRLEESTNQNSKLQEAVGKAEREAREAQSKLAEAEARLKTLQEAEQAARTQAQNKSPQQKLQETKQATEAKLAAVWTIVADNRSGHGFVAEADGKTWLYLPASLFGGSSKLVIKDANSDPVTKFGEFQVAADADLARLEIKQDVAVKFEIDTKAEVTAETNLLLAAPGSAGGALKIEESRAAGSTATDLEINVYGATDNQGCPVIHGESGTVVGIVTKSKATAPDLWTPAENPSDPPKPARLNRAIDWKATTVGAFLAERRKIDELNKLSKLLLALAALNPTTEGLSLDAPVSGNEVASKILDENKALPAVQELLKLNESLAAKKVRVSERDIKRQVGSVYGQIGSASRRAATDLRAAPLSPFHRGLADSALKWNEEAEKKLADVLTALGR